jgi:23S rRNA A2030 N6-methylase RlmJ
MTNKKETEIPKEIQIMLDAQRWCYENDIEHYTRQLVRLFIVIRKNDKVYELELHQNEIENIAKKYKKYSNENKL